MLRKVVSGGQTGVDRAALDAAMACRMAVGGWCPKGRRAEDGVIAQRYPLTETPRVRYAQRTAWNVRDSDATLVLLPAGREPEGGTALTIRLARRCNRPHIVLELGQGDGERRAQEWIVQHRIETINIAGPRESEEPGIYRATFGMLISLFGRYAASGSEGNVTGG